MLIDLGWSALLVAASAAYAGWAAVGASGGRASASAGAVSFSGWQAMLQRARVAKVGPPAAPVLGSGYFARRRWHRAYGCGWRSVQRHRIDRWHYAAR